LEGRKSEMKTFLLKLVHKENLTKEEVMDAARQMFSDTISESEIAAFLVSLAAKGETDEEITGLVEVLREHALPFRKTFPNVMDNCGTGGDGSQSFNISTTSAFVLAGAGVKVAKHGNRSVSSKTGSADVLEHLGIALDFSTAEVEELLEKIGIAFLFAPHVHPNIKRIMKVRKDLKIPTIFNLLGPLINPVKLDYQFLGINRRNQLEMMAKVLKNLGRKRALVVNGAGFMDEASLAGENHFALLENGEIMTFTLSPEEVGLNTYPIESIRGGNANDNAEILLNVLKGVEGPYYETVLLNAGLALFAQGSAETINEGIKTAKESIQTGAALAKLYELVDYSQSRRKKVANS
jgi:anthranilate phosphoribosyltransferase